jgi:hypothetical protein
MTQHPNQPPGQQQGGSWNLAGQGGNSFPFDNIGDYVTGYVMDLAEVQQTDPKDGEPQTWPNGDPKMQYRLSLQTELRDPTKPGDNGMREVYLRGSRKPDTDGGKSSLCAVLDAVRDVTGNTEIQYRGKVTLQYTSDGPQANRAFSPPKRYAAWYEAPAMNLGQQTPNPQQPPAQQGPPPNQHQQQVAQEYAYNPQSQPPPQNPPRPTGPGETNSWQGQGAGPDWAQQPPNTNSNPPMQQQAEQMMNQAGFTPQPHQQQAQPTGQRVDPWGDPPQANPAWGNQPPPDQIPAQQQPPAQQGPAITSAQIAGLNAIGVDPATVYGPDWQTRVVG